MTRKADYLFFLRQVTVDYEKIKAKMAMEEEAEKMGSNVKAYQ